jgi:hypothetical protein
MQVFYRVVRRALIVYEQTRVVFCCEAMREQWGRVIGFGAKGCSRSTSRDVNSYHCHPQKKGFIVELVPIQFCPFCGQVVETCRVK